MKKVVRRKVHHERTSNKTGQVHSQALEKSRRSIKTEQLPITYEIVEHDGGWAYKVNGVFSETFPSHAEALAAAQLAAAE